MRKITRALSAIALFVVFSGVLMVYVAPFLTTKDLSASLGQSAESRVPILVMVQDAGRPIFISTQLRKLNEVTGKYPAHSFLLPTGSNRVIDQDGDPATYTAKEIRPGRQLIQLKAIVGDYPYNVEYEAEETKVFPLRADVKDEKQGVILSILISLFLTWLVMRIAKRRVVAGPQSSGASHNGGHDR